MKPQVLIPILIISLTLFGLLMVGSSSIVTAARDFGDKWYYLKLQSTWAVIGLIGFIIASIFPHQKLEKFAIPLLATTLSLLVLVLIPGLGSKLLGARRWLNLGFFSFQPAELSKLTLIIYFSSLLKKPENKFIPFISIMAASSVLVLLEPDLGTFLVLGGISLLTYFGSGGKILHLLGLAPVMAVLVLSLVIFSPYRAARLRTFFDYTHDPLGASYQIRQSLIGLGSGGLFGVGLGQSRQKYEFLPEVATDSIFAVVGEELGLVGSLCLLTAFMILVSLGLKVAQNAPTRFSANLALGITGWIGIQSFLNISSLVAVTPLTGIPLPFISYGGSSLVILLTASGILTNISKSK